MSGIATGTALAIGLGTAAAGSVASGVIGSNAASNAASTQGQASEYAAQLQQQEAQESLGFEQNVYAQQEANEFPYLQVGESALGNLANLLGILPTSSGTPAQGGATTSTGSTTGGVPTPINRGTASSFPQAGPSRAPNYPLGSTSGLGTQGIGGPTGIGGSTGVQAPNGAPGPVTLSNGTTLPQLPSIGSTVNPSLGSTGSLLAPWTQSFQAPTLQQAEQYPGYQFGLTQGEQAIQDSAAAQGNLLSGGTVNALDQYAQGYAQSDYNNIYNQALQQYQQSYNIFENNQANTYNRLASLAGLGQTSTANLNSAGTSAANTTASTLLNSGAQIGQDVQNASAATASGYIGSSNAITGALSGATGNINTLALLNSLQNSGGLGAYPYNSGTYGSYFS